VYINLTYNLFLQVLYAQAFVLVFLFGKALRKIFFGQLRAAEVEVNMIPNNCNKLF